MDAARRGKWIGFLGLGVTTLMGAELAADEAVAAVIGLDRHAAGPPDRRDLGGAHSRRSLGLREAVAMVLMLGGVTLALQKA